MCIISLILVSSVRIIAQFIMQAFTWYNTIPNETQNDEEIEGQ